MVVIDAKGAVAGRLASKVAKRIIRGETITIVNAEEAVIVGSNTAVMEKFTRRVEAAVKGNPHYGPKYSRIPDRILRRMIRNMLPTKKSAKERIIAKLSVYNSVPKELNKDKMETFDDIKCNERHSFMTMKEIALALGGRW
ncbi:MAG: 50S ribosomal protein L13 [archaeon]